jgi:hypothetical protein
MMSKNAHATCRCVRVIEHDEVRVLGEVVDDGQHHRLAINAGKTFHDVHRNVNPDQRRNVEELDEAGRVEVLRPVPLTTLPRRAQSR